MKLLIFLGCLLSVFLLAQIAHDLSHKYSKPVENKDWVMQCDKFRSNSGACDYYKEA